MLGSGQGPSLVKIAFLVDQRKQGVVNWGEEIWILRNKINEILICLFEEEGASIHYTRINNLDSP